MKTNKLDWDVIYVPVQLEGNAMSEFQMVMLCIIGIAIVSITHSIYLMVQINKRDDAIDKISDSLISSKITARDWKDCSDHFELELQNKHGQFICLKNEIDNITETSVKYNNSPMTVHGQFQSIVQKIDQIVDGQIVYGSPNYWEKPRKD